MCSSMYIDSTAISKIGKSKKTQTVWFPPWAKRDWSLCKVFGRRFTQRYGNNQSFPLVGCVVVDWTAIRLREIDPKWFHWMSWRRYGVVRSVLSVWHHKTALFFSPICFQEMPWHISVMEFCTLSQVSSKKWLATHPFCRASRSTSSVRCSSRVWHSDRTGSRVEGCRTSMSHLNSMMKFLFTPFAATSLVRCRSSQTQKAWIFVFNTRHVWSTQLLYFCAIPPSGSWWADDFVWFGAVNVQPYVRLYNTIILVLYKYRYI